jgi:hypothetical protein
MHGLKVISKEGEARLFIIRTQLAARVGKLGP